MKVGAAVRAQPGLGVPATRVVVHEILVGVVAALGVPRVVEMVVAVGLAVGKRARFVLRRELVLALSRAAIALGRAGLAIVDGEGNGAIGGRRERQLVRHVVDDDVDDDVETTGMRLGCQRAEVLERAHASVEERKVLLRVHVVVVVAVLEDGRDPNGAHAHALDVIQLAHDTAEVAAMAKGEVTLVKVGEQPGPLHVVSWVAISKAIGDELVNGQLAPIFG